MCPETVLFPVEDGANMEFDPLRSSLVAKKRGAHSGNKKVTNDDNDDDDMFGTHGVEVMK